MIRDVLSEITLLFEKKKTEHLYQTESYNLKDFQTK